MSCLPEEVGSLAAIFYSPPESIGEFKQVAPEEMPEDYRVLLAHDDHMTVTVEAFYSSLVDVQVLAENHEGNFYSRKIILKRQDNGAIVLFGIVRLNLDAIPEAAANEIKLKKTPLGRVLIRQNVLRHVELGSLFEVSPNTDLAENLGIAVGKTVYGRIANLHVHSRPAIELLEIVVAD